MKVMLETKAIKVTVQVQSNFLLLAVDLFLLVSCRKYHYYLYLPLVQLNIIIAQLLQKISTKQNLGLMLVS